MEFFFIFLLIYPEKKFAAAAEDVMDEEEPAAVGFRMDVIADDMEVRDGAPIMSTFRIPDYDDITGSSQIKRPPTFYTPEGKLPLDSSTPETGSAQVLRNIQNRVAATPSSNDSNSPYSQTSTQGSTFPKSQQTPTFERQDSQTADGLLFILRVKEWLNFT